LPARTFLRIFADRWREPEREEDLFVDTLIGANLSVSAQGLRWKKPAAKLATA